MASLPEPIAGGCNGLIFHPAPKICTCDICRSVIGTNPSSVVLKTTTLPFAMQAFRVLDVLSGKLEERDLAGFVLPLGHPIHLGELAKQRTSKEQYSAWFRDGPHTIPFLGHLFPKPDLERSVGYLMPQAGRSIESLLLGDDDVARNDLLDRVSVWWPQLVAAVRCLHRAGVAHNDLQLRNIVWDSKTERLRLIDWELASIFRDSNEEGKKAREERRIDQVGQLTLVKCVEIATSFWKKKKAQFADDWDMVFRVGNVVRQLRPELFKTAIFMKQ